MTKQVRVIIIPADPAEPVRRETVTADLKTAQGIVGGSLEGLRGNADEGWAAYDNEESKIFGLPFNIRAHSIMVTLGDHNPLDILRGNVLIVGTTEDGGWVDTPVELWGKILAVPGVATASAE